MLLPQQVTKTLKKKPNLMSVEKEMILLSQYCIRLVVVSHSLQRPSRTYPTVDSKIYLEPILHLLTKDCDRSPSALIITITPYENQIYLP